MRKTHVLLFSGSITSFEKWNIVPWVSRSYLAKFSTWLSEFWSWRLTEVLMMQCLLSERSGVCRLGGDFCWTKTWHEMNVILNRVTTEQGILHTDWAWWFSSLKKKTHQIVHIYIEDNRAKVEKKNNFDW